MTPLRTVVSNGKENEENQNLKQANKTNYYHVLEVVDERVLVAY